MDFKERFPDMIENPKTWLVTGVAGFIGSHLLERLLELNQKVIGLDNLSMGFRKNFDYISESIGEDVFRTNFRFIEGDIVNLKDCQQAVNGVDYVLHQAAVGSVPKSIEDPLRTHKNNVDGFANMLVSAKDAQVKSFVFASSSSVYGDSKQLPQIEGVMGNLLSPYAASKRTNEIYAQAYSKSYNLNVIGLRYFNVFGPRQNPNGAYAAVIPKWIDTMLSGGQCTINGDGSIYRDFTYVDNVVFANLLAALGDVEGFEVFNAALGGKTTLNDLHNHLANGVEKITGSRSEPFHGPGRHGDILTSSADISKIKSQLGFHEIVSLAEGFEKTVKWYADQNPSA